MHVYRLHYSSLYHYTLLHNTTLLDYTTLYLHVVVGESRRRRAHGSRVHVDVLGRGERDGGEVGDTARLGRREEQRLPLPRHLVRLASPLVRCRIAEYSTCRGDGCFGTCRCIRRLQRCGQPRPHSAGAHRSEWQILQLYYTILQTTLLTILYATQYKHHILYTTLYTTLLARLSMQSTLLYSTILCILYLLYNTTILYYTTGTPRSGWRSS